MSSSSRFAPVRWAVLIGAVSVTAAFYLNLCDLIFDCGCHAWWNGAATMCNINDSQTRNCPWCSYGVIRGYLPLALVIATQTAIVFWNRPMSLGLRIALSLAAFPVIGTIVGVIYGIVGHYWS